MKTSDIEVTYLGGYGGDITVVNAARVSFHKEAEMVEHYVIDPDTQKLVKSAFLSEKDVKLVNYLAKHKHFSPFNHAFLSFRVKAPIFVARQLVKHKFMPWNEVSRRYVDEEPEFYFPKYWRAKAANVKQGSSSDRCEAMYLNADKDWINQDIPMPLDDEVNLLICNQVLLYNEMIEKGVAAEQARMILPQNTMTEWIWSGTLGAFLDMLVLRLDPHTQYESRIVAQKIAATVQELFPVSYKARIADV